MSDVRLIVQDLMRRTGQDMNFTQTRWESGDYLGGDIRRNERIEPASHHQDGAAGRGKARPQI